MVEGTGASQPIVPGMIPDAARAEPTYGRAKSAREWNPSGS
jgi:hypothetical protein